ncbi:MAG: hypothetical protein ACYTDT_13165 [Planctomycetota bacterium]|jgi:hypothetical protein
MRILLLILLLGVTVTGCGISQTERWDPDFELEETPAAPEIVETSIESGRLSIGISQEVTVRKTPVERLTMMYEETYSEIDWDGVGGVVFAVLGGIIVVAGSVVGGIYIGE